MREYCRPLGGLAFLVLGAPHLAPAVPPQSARITVSSSPNTEVRIIGARASALQVTNKAVHVLGDTVLARTPLQIEASLEDGDLRFESRDSVPIAVDARIMDAPATRLAATGFAVVLKTGGRGIQIP